LTNATPAWVEVEGNENNIINELIALINYLMSKARECPRTWLLQGVDLPMACKIFIVIVEDTLV